MTLQDLVGVAATADPALPLWHTVMGDTFLELAKSGVIALKSTCPLDPNRKVAYLFYGLPLYVTKPSAYNGKILRGLAIDDIDDLPVAVMLRPDALEEESDAYPMDSGAITSGRYGNILDRALDATMFRLRGRIPDICQRIVTHFFGSNNDYLAGYPHETGRHIACPADFYVSGIHNGAVSADGRRMAAEIVYDLPIALDGNVQAIIVEASRMQVPEYVTAAHALNARLIPYRVRGPFNSDSAIREIVEIAAGHIQLAYPNPGAAP